MALLTKLFNINTYQKPTLPIPRSMWRNPWHFIAFGFGVGALPYAPGTFATLLAIPFYLMLQPLSWIAYSTVVVLLTLGAIYLCDQVSKEIQVHDHPGMCLDEIIGYLITMINAPRGIIWIIVGFLLFRFFDIVKPQPIRWIDEKVTGGLGIILDDIVAGLCSLFIIQLLAWIV